MSKAQIVLEVVMLLQGTPVDAFARQNFAVEDERVVVQCAMTTTLATLSGDLCKLNVATALHRFSYRFNREQLGVLADLYVNAVDALEPAALVRIRNQMCDAKSTDALRDPDAARAVCERISRDF